MDNSPSAEIIDLLQDIERRSRNSARVLPSREEKGVFWEGILCHIAGRRVVVPLQEVKEILNFTPTTTRVPGARDWVVGIANIRGSLLPIIDLQRFLGGKNILRGRRTRVLVIEQAGLLAGLMIEQVLGMRHFSEELTLQAPVLGGEYQEYIDAGCMVDGELWPVFRMKLLAENAGFQVAAA